MLGLRSRPWIVIETLVPARLGTGFRWLLSSSWASNLGDGFAFAAGPLLVASQTDDAFLVAMAATLQWLPHLLFGLHAGAIADGSTAVGWSSPRTCCGPSS